MEANAEWFALTDNLYLTEDRYRISALILSLALINIILTISLANQSTRTCSDISVSI